MTNDPARLSVFVTGGAMGIGHACVMLFAERGHTVTFCDRDPVATESAVQRAREQGLDVSGVVADVTDESALASAIAEAEARDARLDLLVNNAGTHPPAQNLCELDTAHIRNLFELNVIAVFNACRLALPALRRSRGSIVNIASLVGHFGQSQAPSYVATKGAILAFTKALAIDEAPHGVRVNSVSPGNIATPLFDTWAKTLPNPADAPALAARAQWIRRLGTATEVALAVHYLATAATFSTGIDLLVTAGAELGYGSK